MPNPQIPTPAGLSNDVQEFFGELVAEGSDRATALVAAEWLKVALGTLLAQHLVDDQSDPKALLGGPLDSLKPRARLAYALGLIGPKMRQDLLAGRCSLDLAGGRGR